MKKKFTRESKEYQMMQDWWKLWQAYAIPEDNDEYWCDLVADIKLFAKKFDEDVFAVKLATSLIKSLETKYKEK